MPKVYIPNKGGHDYSAALEYGSPIFLSEGFVNRLNVGALARQFEEGLRGSSEEDYLLLTSLPILCMLAGSILTLKHEKLNLLFFQSGKYILREIDFETLLSIGEGK